MEKQPEKMGGDPISLQEPTLQKLTRRQQLFVNLYPRYWCPTKAARAAGFAHPDRQGPRLLRNVVIRAALEEKITQAIMPANKDLAMISEISESDISEFMKIVKYPVMTTTPKLDDDGNPILNRSGKPVLIRVPKLDDKGNPTFDETWEVDLDVVKQRGHLIKRIYYTRNGPAIEMYSRLEALQLIGKHHKSFTESLDITSGGEPLKNDTAGFNRAISTLADAIRETISGPDAGAPGAVATSEQTPVAGSAEQGG